jgi:hypothetical protein
MDSEQPELEPLDETLELIHEHTRGGPARQVAAAEAIDSKAVQVLAAASVVLGLGTFPATDLSTLSAALYALGAAAYLLAGRAALKILRTRSYRVVDGADQWWPSHRLAETAFVREQILNDLASANTENRRLLDEKGAPLDELLVATALEALLVAGAVVAALA